MAMNIHKIKMFLKTKTEEEMVVAQLTNNIKHNKQFTYDIYENKDGDIIAWFNMDVSGASNGD